MPDEIEQIIQDKELTTGPRVTPEDIEALIYQETYTVHGRGLTICILELVNGFYVVDKSAPVSEENFDEDLGRMIARRNCITQLWALAGYHLKQTQYERAEMGKDIDDVLDGLGAVKTTTAEETMAEAAVKAEPLPVVLEEPREQEYTPDGANSVGPKSEQTKIENGRLDGES